MLRRWANINRPCSHPDPRGPPGRLASRSRTVVAGAIAATGTPSAALCPVVAENPVQAGHQGPSGLQQGIPRAPHMKRPCQALAGRRVVDHSMSVFRGCFWAWSACPPGWRFRRDGCVRPPLAGPDRQAKVWACPRFPARGALGSAVQAGPQGADRR
jgi:hypothetical protein